MLRYRAYMAFYQKAKKDGNLQVMEYHLNMVTISCKLELLRYRLRHTEPWFQGLVPDDAEDPYDMIKMWIRMYKMRQDLMPFAEALEKAVDEAYKWKHWFLDPRLRAVQHIKRAWRKAIDNPNTEVGKNHLRRDFENFQVKFSTDFV